MSSTFLSWIIWLTMVATSVPDGVIEVRDGNSLRRALADARPGTHIRIAPGTYPPGIFVRGLRGTAERRIVIEGADPQKPPLFEGGTTGWQLSDCEYLTLRHLAVRGQSGNGINIDDGGTYDTPSHIWCWSRCTSRGSVPRATATGSNCPGSSIS
jgi:hypothetical protein